MARRRLTPPRPDFLGTDATDLPADLETKAMFPMGVAQTVTRAPIAQVAAEAAAEAALSDLSAEVARTRAEGRMIERLPLDAVDPGYLVRDRQSVDAEDMETLIASIRARGQQMPIEVVDQGTGAQPRYGLISGWRRLMALRQIGGGDILAIVRRPENAAEAYVAMVEENEIRAGISFYERARIVVKALEAGIYPDVKTALNGLFGNVSRAKRSKIKSFMVLVETLDDKLRFPEAISEKTGLAVVQAIEAGQGGRLVSVLSRADILSASDENGVLSGIVKSASVTSGHGKIAGNLQLNYDADAHQIIISGDGVGPELARKLQMWLEKHQGLSP